MTAQSFIGKWKLDKSSYAGAEEYFAALGQSEMLKDFEGANETEVMVEGNTITFVTHIENKEPRTDVVHLGETDEFPMANGVKMMSKSRLEGDRIVSDLYMGDNLVMTFVRYVKGNELHSEMTANGKTLIFKATRV